MSLYNNMALFESQGWLASTYKLFSQYGNILDWGKYADWGVHLYQGIYTYTYTYMYPNRGIYSILNSCSDSNNTVMDQIPSLRDPQMCSKFWPFELWLLPYSYHVVLNNKVCCQNLCFCDCLLEKQRKNDFDRGYRKIHEPEIPWSRYKTPIEIFPSQALWQIKLSCANII